MADDQDRTDERPTGGQARARRVLTDIAPYTWEHPADKAALQALRRIPVFDEVLRKTVGYLGEKPTRLAFQADSVRIGKRQFPEVYKLYLDCLKTLDAPDEYPLFVSQTPMVNAGAWGMDHPFIVVQSGTIRLLDDHQLQFVLGHEIGHVMSDHVLYNTMTRILLEIAGMGFPIVGLAARVVLIGLLEWQRKAELSADRAGLLTVQDPELVMNTMLKMAGGGTPEESNLGDFIVQADEYRAGGDLLDQVFKVLNLIGRTHPFYTLRLGELRNWIEAGEYDRVLRGEYPRRGEPNPAYQEDLRAAAKTYTEGAKDLLDNMADAAKRMGSDFLGGLKR